MSLDKYFVYLKLTITSSVYIDNLALDRVLAMGKLKLDLGTCLSFNHYDNNIGGFILNVEDCPATIFA